MNKVSLFLFIPLLAFCFHSYGQKNDNRIKVMTYNIRHASPPSAPSKIDLDTIAAIIRKQNPDLLAMQEVDVKTRRSGVAVDEATELANKTGMHATFGKAISFDGGEYGVAILSKLPVDSFTLYRLPGIGDEEARILLVGFIRINTKTIAFGCTHLDAGNKDNIRLLQVKTIGEIQKDIKQPMILAGDLNAEAGGPVINYVDGIFKRSCLSNCPLTIPNDKPVATIDYVAFRPAGQFKVISHNVLKEAYASDHLPLVVELDINW